MGEGANEGFTIESACLVDAFARWLDAIGHALLIDRKDPIVADRDAINTLLPGIAPRPSYHLECH